MSTGSQSLRTEVVVAVGDVVGTAACVLVAVGIADTLNIKP
jgi:hypothetical protein